MAFERGKVKKFDAGNDLNVNAVTFQLDEISLKFFCFHSPKKCLFLYQN